MYASDVVLVYTVKLIDDYFGLSEYFFRKLTVKENISQYYVLVILNIILHKTRVDCLTENRKFTYCRCISRLGLFYLIPQVDRIAEHHVISLACDPKCFIHLAG